jgi:hypothetical protein
MPGSAAPTVEPVCTAHDLGHSPARVGTAGDEVAMIPMGGMEQIVGRERRRDRRSRRFVTDMEMLAPHIRMRLSNSQDLFFKPPHAQHALEQGYPGACSPAFRFRRHCLSPPITLCGIPGVPGTIDIVFIRNPPLPCTLQPARYG